MKAKLRFHRQAPRKTRLVADFVRGKEVTRALTELEHLNKRASGALKKLIESAVANAKHHEGVEQDQLFIKEIRVDKGITFKRFRARSRGRAAPVRKITSHVSLTLGQKTPKEAAVK